MENGWNWVSALSACSITSAFQELKNELERDVSERNGIRPVHCHYQFEIALNAGAVVIMVSGKGLKATTVTFAMVEKRRSVAVSDDTGKVMFEAILTLNDQRECRFTIDGREHESWQLRKRALETLFFQTV